MWRPIVSLFYYYYYYYCYYHHHHHYYYYYYHHLYYYLLCYYFGGLRADAVLRVPCGERAHEGVPGAGAEPLEEPEHPHGQRRPEGLQLYRKGDFMARGAAFSTTNQGSDFFGQNELG